MKKVRGNSRSRKGNGPQGRGGGGGARRRGRGEKRRGVHGPTNGNARGNSRQDAVPEVMSSRTRTGSFEDLFTAMPKNVRAIGERLREIVRTVLPGSTETVYLGWKIALYSDPSEVCGIQPVQSKYCNLYFSNGARMNDPGGLLEGTGKNIRHVKVRNAEEIPVEGLMELIREAKRVSK